jgi:predicted nuclease with RNAse H fold
LLEGLKAKTALLYTDEEILDWVRKEKPELIAIDAPLTLPPGRKSIDERNDSHYRPCDMELRRRKIPFFPITLGPMRVLTKRGIMLREILEDEGFRVVEIYPGGAQDIWQIPRAKRSLSGLRDGLRKLGILNLKKTSSDHELDAASGALVGFQFLQGKAEVYGDFKSGAIIMPFQP